jgi:hypothetical protein
LHYGIHKLIELIFGKEIVLLIVGWGLIIFGSIGSVVFLCCRGPDVIDFILSLSSHSQRNKDPVRRDVRVPWYLRLILASFCIAAIGGGIWMVGDITGETNPDRAASAIQRLSGEITRDETAADRPIIKVSFCEKHLSDWELGRLKRHLECLTRLGELDLRGTEITSSGLEYLSSLKQLKKLKIGCTVSLPVQDKNDVRQMVSDETVADLRRALPNTEIEVIGPVTLEDFVNARVARVVEVVEALLHRPLPE